MTTQLSTIPERAQVAGISLEIWDALTSSIYPGAQPESIVMAYQYCKARRLDPLKKPVHIVPMYVRDSATGKGSMRDVIMPGIHELRTTASRTNLMAGTDAPVFGEPEECPVASDAKQPRMLTTPGSCSVTVWRLDANGVRQPYTHIEFFAEAVARTKEGIINAMWQKRPRGQLAKCAEAGALRKAFPEELGGVMSAEEMEGREIDEGAIDGEFVVTSTTEGPIRAPESTAGSTKATEPEKAAQPAQAEQPQSKPVEPAAPAEVKEPTKEATKEESKPAVPPKTDDKPARINLPDAARKILINKLQQANISESELLAKFGDVNIGTINAAFTWIKDQAPQ